MQDYRAAREAMVDRQVRPADVTRRDVIDAMLWTPRERFVAASRRAVAYAGEAVEMGRGRKLLEPRTFAKMLDFAEIEPGDAALDIGCGLGYSTAVLSQLCRGVVAVECDEAMARQADETLGALGIDNAAVLHAPLEGGAPDHGPYDVIIVNGAIAAPPSALYDQLAEDGRIVAIWMREGHGAARIGVKAGGLVSDRWAFDAAAPVLPGFEAAPSFAF